MDGIVRTEFGNSSERGLDVVGVNLANIQQKFSKYLASSWQVVGK